MKIIILGAGQVGGTLAENLARESNDITVVDKNTAHLAELGERLDIRTVHGFASYPEVLRRAGADDAEMVIAVTDSDETNMLACKVAYTLFQTPTKIARVRSQEYLQDGKLFEQDALSVDLHISPEQLVTDYIHRLIEYPGSLQVVDFANGRVRLVGVKAYYGGPLVSRQLKELPQHLPDIEARVAAIYRRGRPILPEGDTIIEAEDEVFFIAASEHIRRIMSELRKQDKPVKRVMLAGGGNIGLRLAKALEAQMQVKIIERNRDRTTFLSEQLSRSIVLCGDAANEQLLLEENIEDVDVFCAVTNDDEANILSAMLAKRLGARKALSLINRLSYVDLVEGGAIDIAISPQQSTVSALLAHVRRGDVVRVHSLRRGAAEAIEAVAHGDRKSSKVVGRRIEEIKLPPGSTIGAVVRGDEVIIAHHDTVIQADDHVILFLVDKKHTRDVERLFQVGVSFL
ncbi:MULTISPECIES: Trk system potassium transporter TrkA [Hydrocarboniphaga]|uniref:Trk system potassium uptake protein TrkA n=1 Tax=Hydrocarboniphaga effusa AP103 TaxID=1172194 RepID=I8TD83_9GAMM|nr:MULTISPECIES: Trk system potassium transporter TrkA [Hydrocarboniphaga]EIT71663.1 TrkA-N domain protein [Hydrocarboniphaga effusa AP103]MDZ4080288.1 Trk system potassium transporter TrkA [Hydrocarboniphaga sp.]